MARNIKENKLLRMGFTKEEVSEMKRLASTDKEFAEYYKQCDKERHKRLAKKEERDRRIEKLIGQIAFIIIGVAIAVPLRMCMSCESDKSDWQYHDKNGNKQIQYQGSQEQQRDLEEIDRYFGY